MSMLLGFRSEILASADALEPRNLHNGATWPYPPTMLMRIMDDEKEVVERCNKTIVVMNERVRPRAPAPRGAQCKHTMHGICIRRLGTMPLGTKPRVQRVRRGGACTVTQTGLQLLRCLNRLKAQEAAANAGGACAGQGVDVTEWRIRPYALSETFFAERLRGCDYACSAEVYGRLREADIIDARGFSKWHKCENCWCAARAPARRAVRVGSVAARRAVSAASISPDRVPALGVAGWRDEAQAARRPAPCSMMRRQMHACSARAPVRSHSAHEDHRRGQGVRRARARGRSGTR
jgi:hypothetical protein